MTTGYHLFRTLAIARRIGLAHAVGIAAGNPEWFLLGHLVRESVALAKDMLAADNGDGIVCPGQGQR